MAYFLVGLALGLLFGAAAAGWLLRRHLAKVRSAERRAREAERASRERERMAEIGAMTSGLAHEIKNPLSTIGLNAQLLAEGVESLPVEPEQKTRLVSRMRTLRREADRLKGILQDFLEFAGQVRLERAPADLNAVVGELVDFFEPEAQRHGVRIMPDLHPTPLVASIDAQRIKQALLNLMLNATQAMAAQRSAPVAEGAIAAPGHLMLRTRPAVDAQRRPVVSVQVTDTGPGMSDAVLAKVFTPYFTTKAGGSGLGLPTALRLVEAHGGRLSVHSEVGRGTEFTMALPAEPGPRTGEGGPG
jgi:signal transduction histidine kinase